MLITLLASIDGASSDFGNGIVNSKLESRNSAIRVLSAEHGVNGKRSLRGNDDEAIGGDLELQDEEERAFSFSSIVDRIKSAFSKLRSKIIRKREAYLEHQFMKLYQLGVTPVNLRAMYMGRPGYKKSLSAYKTWYDEKVATGILKPN